MKQINTPDGPRYVVHGQAHTHRGEALVRQLRFDIQATLNRLIKTSESNDPARILAWVRRFVRQSNHLTAELLKKEQKRQEHLN